LEKQQKVIWETAGAAANAAMVEETAIGAARPGGKR
jgi:hypothetical protein